MRSLSVFLLLLIDYWRRMLWIKVESISKNYLYVANAIKEFHFLECCLFSNFLFLEKLASIVPMFQSDYDYNWRLNFCLAREDSIKVIVQLYKRFPISGGTI